jgi:diguanylate cyclase (GGDEF)-like protein
MALKAVRYGIGTNSLGFRLTAIYIALAGICLALATMPFLSEHSVSDVALHMNMAMAGLIGTAVLMALMSRRLTGPIRKLTEVAREVSEGHLNVKVPVDCSCEIGELGASMRTMVARLQASTAEISEPANHDLVTGLPNRARLQTLLERQTGLVGADGVPASGSAFFIDVLELRKVNDRFGHETSDELLRTIASLLVAASPCKSHGDNLRNSASEDDVLREPVFTRFGGTELVLCVPGLTDPDEIASVARRLHAALAGGVKVGGRQFYPSIAIGIARYPQDSASAIQVKQYAALACNNSIALQETERTVLFQSWMIEVIKSRETMERDLRTAIADGHFEVYYQPKVSAHDWTVTGVEALVRLNHPERGLVGPGDFIEIAEMTGLIYDIGLIVLEEAICQCSEWHRAGQSTEVSINVSVEQFRNTEFSNLVIALLNEHACPADLVTIEITETIAHTNIGTVSDHIKALRAVGVRIAIDDFGTGYSNLAQLTGLKFDILKVDRSFVSGIDSEGKAREVSRAIIQLGKNLGCRVVVEGTETPGQVAAAAQLGCDEIQGFFFSKPMKRSDFDTWKQLRARNPVRDALDSIVAGGLTKIIPPQGRLTAS